MKAKETGKTQEDAAKEEKAERPHGLAEMCRQIMAGGVPPCCGPQMRDMMSQCMAQFQVKEGK